MQRKYDYRRNLPHYQKTDRPHFVTFITKERWILPVPARTIAMKACLHVDGKQADIHGIVVMPDHVHILLTPLRGEDGDTLTLPAILHSVKSFSAHAINRKLGRNSPVWLDESFDHVLRSEDDLDAKIEYLRQNPVRRGLVRTPKLYRWLWTEKQLHTGETPVPHK